MMIDVIAGNLPEASPIEMEKAEEGHVYELLNPDQPPRKEWEKPTLVMSIKDNPGHHAVLESKAHLVNLETGSLCSTVVKFKLRPVSAAALLVIP